LVSLPVVNLDGGNDVGLDAVHEMHLPPIVLPPDHSVLVIELAREPRCGEAGRIRREIQLYRFERQAALHDQAVEDRGYIVTLQIGED
jgi:hypothetical protein